MTAPNTVDNNGELAAPSRWFHRRESLISYALVLFAVAFNLYYLYPEVAGDVIARNDNVFHLLAIEMAVEAITQGQDFTDPWESSMGMGFPLFHYYQHLPQITLALVHVLTLGVIPLADMLNWTNYLLLSLFPLSIYWSLRCFGFDQLSAALGGLVAPLISTSGIFGLSFASYVFRGWGIYTQLWAMLLLPPALALSYRVLQEGRGYFWATLLLAATLLSHLIYGYMAFLTLGVLTLIHPARLSNPKSFMESMWRRWNRLIILFLLVVVVTSYFLVPIFLDLPYLNRSIWHTPTKYDSYGYSLVLRGLAVGDLFDFNRFSSLTYLVAVGFVICLLRWRNERYRMPVAIFSFWLLLFFGRTTWGGLIDLLPMSRDIHMSRFIGGVHLGGIFLIAVALAAPWRWALSRARVWYVAAALALTLLVLLPVYSERRSYLAQNAALIKESQALVAEDDDLTALFEQLKQLPPGRVWSGHERSFDHWSDRYLVGPVKVRDLLQAEGLDMVGKVYHSYSLNSDVLIDFDEQRWEHYNLYNARYVVAPEDQIFPDFVRPLQQFGRHRLYQVDTTGYFDLVGSGLEFVGGRTDFYPAASAWLASELPSTKQHPTMLLGRPANKDERGFTGKVEATAGPSRGTVLSEEVGNNYFAAKVTVERESLLMLKATYHPNWRATVDGVKTDTVMLMPSFVGVELSPGDHKVRMEYRPRRLRVILLGFGLLTLSLIAVGEKRATALSSRFSAGIFARISGSVKWPRSTRRRRRQRRRIRR
ncbi:MAG: YfhO family protein [Chloroflexi bacterium]|nr:YfhO family protein [Chloroflexota bacterium]MCI0785284.1 YfhO family protein [Chloroflexota bacterium]MCI0793707.1 YfhO family protein [Chloroflexota bacterium]MCI0797694.1 YfhO family protein [Chloroflexota bacterium]MCI0865418.1 YfhO family protein [Chloroflexota bacterium]